jgi:hypothetical protein
MRGGFVCPEPDHVLSCGARLERDHGTKNPCETGGCMSARPRVFVVIPSTMKLREAMNLAAAAGRAGLGIVLPETALVSA